MLTKTRKVRPDTLVEIDYGEDQPGEISRIINAEKRNLFEVLAYVAFVLLSVAVDESSKGNSFRIT